MDNFFRRRPGATWPGGRLHVYVVADQNVQRAAEKYQASLLPVSGQCVGLQPVAYLHATVQALDVHVTIDLDGALTGPDRERTDALAQSIIAATAMLEPFTLNMGPPQVSRHAIELWADPCSDDHWHALTDTVRQASAAVVGNNALLAKPAYPHISIAYGTGPGDSGALGSTLKTVRQPMVEMPINHVHLVAVDQHPDIGVFTWHPIATAPLAHRT